MIWSGIGVNYGHQFGLPYDSTQVDNDFTVLWNAGVTKIRVAIPTFGASAYMDDIADIAIRALAKGFYTSWGVTSTSGSPVTATVWGNFKTYVTGTLAPWAQTHGLSELSMGNEEELHCDGTTLTTTTVRSDIKTMATTVKSGGYTGLVSYQADESQIATWASLGLGSLDRIGFNCYGTLDNFTQKTGSVLSSFGANGYVSEFGTLGNGYSDFNDEYIWYRDTIKRIQIMKTSGIGSGYYFCYRDGAFGITADTFAVVLSTNAVRLARGALFDVEATPGNKYPSVRVGDGMGRSESAT